MLPGPYWRRTWGIDPPRDRSPRKVLNPMQGKLPMHLSPRCGARSKRAGEPCETKLLLKRSRRHLLKLYEGVQVSHSFFEAGHYVDCVPISQQPSLKGRGEQAAKAPPRPTSPSRPPKGETGSAAPGKTQTLDLRLTRKNQLVRTQDRVPRANDPNAPRDSRGHGAFRNLERVFAGPQDR